MRETRLRCTPCNISVVQTDELAVCCCGMSKIVVTEAHTLSCSPRHVAGAA